MLVSSGGLTATQKRKRVCIFQHDGVNYFFKFLNQIIQDRNEIINDASQKFIENKLTAAEFLRRVSYGQNGICDKLESFDTVGENDDKLVDYGEIQQANNVQVANTQPTPSTQPESHSQLSLRTQASTSPKRPAIRPHRQQLISYTSPNTSTFPPQSIAQQKPNRSVSNSQKTSKYQQSLRSQASTNATITNRHRLQANTPWTSSTSPLQSNAQRKLTRQISNRTPLENAKTSKQTRRQPLPTKKASENPLVMSHGSKMNVNTFKIQPGILVVFGAIVKEGSLSGQIMSEDYEWSPMPAIVSKKDGAKITRHNASFLHIGENRIVISGGVDSQTLKRVCFIIIHLELCR